MPQKESILLSPFPGTSAEPHLQTT